MVKIKPAQMEFHVSRRVRDRYRFEESFFSLSGNVFFANFQASRRFAQKMNAQRDLLRYPEQAIWAGQINAMGLVDEILHYIVSQYRQQRNPQVMSQALNWLGEKLGEQAVSKTLYQFASQFPPLAVYRGEIELDDYLAGESRLASGAVVQNRELVLEELLMLWLANMNPAFSPYRELFDDTNLKKETAYIQVIVNLKEFFDTQSPFGSDNQNLVDLLRSLAIAVPDSLTGQLEYIRTRWGIQLLSRYLNRLMSSLDFVKEEEKPVFGVGGGGSAQVYEFGGMEQEPERFSPDQDWMPNLVLIAKNSYVWLDQLSKKYLRSITRLDQVPDEELDTLSRWGLTGLWLIGLWERSVASKKIKQLRGNPDAVASAYSLFSYDIAADLGGEESFNSLRERAWRRGIRLASDMVPNHMGIDSRWVVEHPDWFVALDYSPFPSYTFNGLNLSWDNRVGIFLEDHYYNNTDAAVVFKRVDFWSGNEKYIYHGNDGTSMPWNDTAQLNYLKAEVREAVIQTILHVARKFPIIRFDAAMTLAKKHYQRLWYPEPGGGGDIPSRAEFGLPKNQFDAVFPQEFWREVVDRVAQEVPDTLLLAEAFWLMEGYFVRTLGMHRVYNSAFMNMLREEKNQEYRLVIKNTIEFDPEILKRYVNFMNNPDERTAVDQFGKGDKYLGICTLMATMPGLPMFGHGQVEGFTEKYGMEYRRAYYDEQPDQDLVARHEHEIFPLLRRRYLFAGVQNFLLYDFYTPEGNVNEDVFAHSNRAGNERALVVYHNRYARANGWIRISAAFPVKSGAGDGRVLVQKNLGEGLDLQNDANSFTIFHDHISGLEYIRNNRELHEQGLYVELGAYQHQVFLNFRQVQDSEAHLYGRLANSLKGQGIPSIEQALKELYLQPLHQAFRELANAGMLRWLIENQLKVSGSKAKGLAIEGEVHQPANIQLSNLKPVLDEAEHKMVFLLREVKRLGNGQGDENAIAAEIRQELAEILALPVFESRFPLSKSRKYKAAIKYLLSGPNNLPTLDSGDPVIWGPLLGWLFVHKFHKVLSEADRSTLARAWLEDWLLGKILARAFQDLGLDEAAAWHGVEIVRLLVGADPWYEPLTPDDDLALHSTHLWLQDSNIQHFLKVHRYEGILWFNKEAFEELLWWKFVLAVVKVLPLEPQKVMQEVTEGAIRAAPSSTVDDIIAWFELIKKLLVAEEKSGYQMEKLLEVVKE